MKKQASLSPSSFSIPTFKISLQTETILKIPETGNVKFVSPISLMASDGKKFSFFSCGAAKSPPVIGSSNSVIVSSNGILSWQISNGQLSSASKAMLPRSSQSIRRAGRLQVLLIQLDQRVCSQGPKDSSEGVLQNDLKERPTGQKRMCNTKTPVKSGSFMVLKPLAASEPQSKNELFRFLKAISGPRILSSKPGIASTEHNGGFVDRFVDLLCEAEDFVGPRAESECCCGGGKGNKSSKQDTARWCEAIICTTHDKVMITAYDRSEELSSL